MDENSQLSYASGGGRADNKDDDDSFYAQGDVKQDDHDKRANSPEQAKHKSPKIKKKGIFKKKEKSSKGLKKPQLSKEKQKQMKMVQIAEEKVDGILLKMKHYYDEDIRLFEAKKLACKKLSYIEELGKLLRNVYISEKFIEKDGLTLFQRWLDKIPVGNTYVEPSVSLRKGIMEILYNLTISGDNLSKINEIQRLVVRQKRSQIKQLKDLSEKIILKWNQLSYEES